MAPFSFDILAEGRPQFRPVGVFDMAGVPRDRGGKFETGRAFGEVPVVVGRVPVPAGEDALANAGGERCGVLRGEVGNEIDSEPELVRALERSRFRNTFFDEVSLPHGRAKCLEDFEAGLRAAGLVGVHQILVQSGASGRKFRVAKRQVGIDGHISDPSEEKPVANALSLSAVESERLFRAGSQPPALRHSKNGRRPRF